MENLVPVRSISLTILLLLWSGHGVAQISSASRAEADRFNQIAERTISRNLDSAYILASRAFDLSKMIDYPEGMITSLDILARYYGGKSNINASMEKYFQKMDLYRHHPDLPGQSSTLAKISSLFSMAGAPEKAEYYLGQAREVLTNHPSALDAAYYYDALANHEMKLNHFIPARDAWYMAIALYFKLGSNDQTARCYRNLGDLFLHNNFKDNAIFLYRKALDEYGKSGNMMEQGIVLTRIGHVYQEKRDTVKLLKNNLEALRIREKIGRPDFYGASLINVGAIYMESGRPDSALLYLNKGLEILEKAGNMMFLENACRQLYFFYKGGNNHQKALYYYRQYIDLRLKNRIARSEAALSASFSKRTLMESENRRQLLKQMNQIQELQIRNRKVRILLYEVLFLALSGMVILILFQARKVKQSQKSLLILNNQMENEIQQRIEAEKKIAESETLYRFIAENTTDVISLLDARLNRVYISPSCRSVYGYEEQEIYAMEGIVDLIEEKHRVRVLKAFSDMMKEKEPAKFTYQALRKDGTTFWAESLVNPIFDPGTGELRELVTVVRDISRRMEYEEMIARNSSQRELLLREIHHRVKNNFAILISLMELQKQMEQGLLSHEITDLQLRVRAMSLVHEQLYRSDSIHDIRFDEYLRNLSMIISSAFSNHQLNLHTLIEPCSLHIRLALPLGLIVNELLTNAYKYAFPDNEAGNVWVNLERDRDRIRLTIADDGIGLPDGFDLNNPVSMGSKIIMILIEQIEARLEVGRDKGARFTINFSDQYD